VSILIERSPRSGQVAILIQNADGFITHQKIFAPVDGMPDAEMIAGLNGFDLDGDWFSEGDETSICYLRAKPLLISFVADAITDEDAVAAARGAGYPVLSLTGKRSVPEKGKVECQFLLELPTDFTLEGFEPLEPFGG
jgi:hypothetical protein